MTHPGLQLPSFMFEGTPAGQMFDRIAATAQADEESGFGPPHGAPLSQGAHAPGQRNP